jgi:hypothetical protein
MNTDDFRRWMDAYGASWIAQRPDTKKAIFTDNATYMYTPFHPLIQGIDKIIAYSGNSARLQKDIQFDYKILAVTEEYGISRWMAGATWRATEQRIRFDGIYQVFLNAEGKCYRFDEWWHSDPALPADISSR